MAALFAISYKLDGPLDDLKTDVNMMSAVTPGALRELLQRRRQTPCSRRRRRRSQRAP